MQDSERLMREVNKEIKEQLEEELYELQEELDEAETELYCWQTRVNSLNKEKESLVSKIKEKSNDNTY